MNDYLIGLPSLLNESDVEQKVIMPLLVNEEPWGLGIAQLYIMTKYNLRQIEIGKRSNAKIYYPDYVVIIDGLPLVVIEVKRPGEDLDEAFREARLYASELNSYFKDINPCTLVLASDGLKLKAGKWDVGIPNLEIDVKDWIPTNHAFGVLINTFGLRAIIKQVPLLKSQLRSNTQYSSPLRLLGGKNIQHQAVNNTFGETISIQYRHLFNPTDEAERTEVVSNAYVKVEKHLSHVDPIDRLIRKKVRTEYDDSNEIEDNLNPTEIIDKLRIAHNFNNQVLLLVGSGGSGKSTFTTYLKDVALDTSLTQKLFWVRLDLNFAPVSSQEIYSWLKTNIVKEIVQSSKFDVGELDVIKKIYSSEIEEFDKVAVELLEPTTYKMELFKKIQELKADKDITLKSYINYFIHQKSKDLIIVLDNCDKKESEKQLLMFEVANWLKENTKSIVFLPMRDTTFDLYRHQPPLDTVVKDLIFRINPPSLDRVLMARVKYAARLSQNNDTKYYTLSNGINVKYPSKDEITYLRSILKSLFQNSLFKKMINGLAGRDTRKGIEIFMEFCKSGHITANEILQMKYSDEYTHSIYKIPNHIISKVFFRGNRKYYSDSDTRVKNLFYSDPSDNLPDPFIRVRILRWLEKRSKLRGPSNSLGFHKVSSLIKDLIFSGHSKERIEEELKALIRFELIISETQNYEEVDFEELISINAPGVIHLKLLEDVDYLGTCAEDVWYNSESIASKISNSMAGKGKFSHLSLQTSLENGDILVKYLRDYYSRFFEPSENYLIDSEIAPILDFSNIELTLKSRMANANLNTGIIFGIGEIIEAKVVNIFSYGLTCELAGSPKSGFLRFTNENRLYDEGRVNIDDTLKVRILKYSKKFRKYDVEIAP